MSTRGDTRQAAGSQGTGGRGEAGGGCEGLDVTSANDSASARPAAWGVPLHLAVTHNG